MTLREASPGISATTITEDDSLRSQFMRRLLDESRTVPHVCPGAGAPGLLAQFWDDASAIPGDVRGCLDSWAPVEVAGIERLLFDDTSANRFIETHYSSRHVRAFNRCIHPAMRADYFRSCFILQTGSLYVDADDMYQGADLDALLGQSQLKVQALCYDKGSGSMVDVVAALADSADADRIFYVNNNPLIASPGHPVIARTLERATNGLLATHEVGRDIQSLTGPGNLTASLVAHAVDQGDRPDQRDFDMLTAWESVAVSKRPLEYRDDARNWRHWVRGEEMVRR